MRTSLQLGFALLCLSIILFLWSDIKNAAASITEPNPPKIEGMTPLYSTKPGLVTVTQRWELPDVLKEISDISPINDTHFACIQDELGTIFIYNTQSSKIEREVPFGGPGDYEGITMVKGTAWVLRSDGMLFEVQDIDQAKPAIKEYPTSLNGQQNAEGICFDSKNNRLLMAVKDGDPGPKDHKGIYSFDLSTHKVAAAPAFKIALQDKIFNNMQGKKKRSGELMPSSIAIHPSTREIFITDGRNSKLLVTDASGALKRLYDLDQSEFPQPEGIAFRPDGSLFISNEGTKRAGNILRVEIKD